MIAVVSILVLSSLMAVAFVNTRYGYGTGAVLLTGFVVTAQSYRILPFDKRCHLFCRGGREAWRLFCSASVLIFVFGDGVMGYGLWVMGYGLWVMGYGLWVMGYGLWVRVAKRFDAILRIVTGGGAYMLLCLGIVL